MQHDSQFDRLNALVEQLVTERYTTSATWRKIDDNLFGIHNFETQRTPGTERLAVIYDDTAKVSKSLLSGAIHSLMSSPASHWFGLGFEDPNVQDIRGAVEWLYLAEQRLYTAIAAPEANFHAQLSETYGDLIGFGTGVLFIDDVPGAGVRFSSRPLDEIYLAEDPSGRIDTIVRKFRLTARNAVKLWGDAAKAATRALEAGHSEDREEYVHLIMPSDDISVGNVDTSGMAWSSFHISPGDKTILDTGGYHELPMATPRWEKISGEVYGRGCGYNALSNQKMLNEMRKVRIKAGQKAVDPPMMVDSEGVLPGDLRTHPGSIIPINSIMASMNPPIQPLLSGGDTRMTTEDIKDTSKSVQSSFLNSLVEQLRDPRMTATQVMQLSNQMMRHLAPILGRLSTELLEPIIERVFAIEARAGRLPPVPEEIADRPIKINYVNPIAKAQQTGDAMAIIDFAGVVTQLSLAQSDVLDVVDFDEQIRSLAVSMGVPPTGIRDKRAVKIRREAAAQLAAEEQEQQQLIAATDQIAKLAKAMPQQQGAA